MSRLRSAEGFGFVSIVVSLLITFLLITIYLREYAPVGGAKDGPAGSALEATNERARQFEVQQNQRLEQMDEAAR